MPKLRLDQLLVNRKLCETREIAQYLIITGNVLINEVKITKSGQQVSEDSTIRLLTGLPKYVSRGATKLSSALDQFKINPVGRRALDVGISTGGFTDFLRQHGARSVIGLDVGYGQVSEKIRRDSDVAIFERTNVRHLSRDRLLDLIHSTGRSSDWVTEIDIVVMDVSFISVIKVLPAVRDIVPSGDYIILVKPQFEAEKHEVGKGGIIRDPELNKAIVDRVKTSLSSTFDILEQCESGITGTKGNQEHFLWLRPTIST